MALSRLVFFFVLFKLSCISQLGQEQATRYARRPCRRFCGSLSKVNKRSSPSQLFFLQTFCSASAATLRPCVLPWGTSRASANTPAKHDVHCLRTCTHRYPSGECVSLLFSTSWRLIRDLIAFLIATAAVSQEINTCNIHGTQSSGLISIEGGEREKKKNRLGDLFQWHISSQFIVFYGGGMIHGCISQLTMPAACHAHRKFRPSWRWVGGGRVGGSGRLRDCK